MTGTLLVAGTTSDAGKSLLTAGICRWLARRGVRVAPFKAQNMSNNSVALADGGEIGRAQALQAAACGIEPEAAMNPVLLKPGTDRSSHVVLLGRPHAEVSATTYPDLKQTLRDGVLAAFDDLAARFDAVICEGAGSPTEINLRGHDIANLGLARDRDIPVIVVGDIDRGGVLAAFFGTLALLADADQALVSGFLVNKFRGDVGLLAPGLQMLRGLTGRPTLGVVPWLDGVEFDGEDSLALRRDPPPAGPPRGGAWLRVVAVRLPRVSNSTDVDALAQEPGVLVRWSTSPWEVAEADLVVLPGSRATVADLAWLRAEGIADALAERARTGRPVLGLCGGYQMLGRSIRDGVESRAGTVAGLGLLPVDVAFAAGKTLGRPQGRAYGVPVTTGYEIHHGVATVDEGAPAFLDGTRSGAVWGTHWHGAFDTDAFRRAFLTEVAAVAGVDFAVAPDTDLGALRAARLDALADAVEQHCDTAALDALIRGGAPAGLPFVPPGAP
jgi:adenosylcobyric acid synthase